jgi:hypothetical protein
MNGRAGNRERVLALILQHPEGLDDDEIASMLGFRQRQQANQRCRQLSAEGLVERRRVGGKIRNFPSPDGTAKATARATLPAAPLVDRHWFWGGNVQTAVATHLSAGEWVIDQVADTASRAPGKDIVAHATDLGSRLWVSVKGFPQGTARTNAPTQARHWFSHALFDMVLWRGEDRAVQLAVAFPDFPTYRNLTKRISWFKDAVPFTLFWVTEDGRVQPS